MRARGMEDLMLRRSLATLFSRSDFEFAELVCSVSCCFPTLLLRQVSCCLLRTLPFRRCSKCGELIRQRLTVASCRGQRERKPK